MKNKKKTLLTLLGLSLTFGISFSTLHFNEVKSEEPEPIKYDETLYAKPFYTPGDRSFSTQKSYALNHVANFNDLENAWNITKGEGTKIAIIDSGIDVDHPDFEGKISSRSASYEAVIIDGYYQYDNNNPTGIKINKTLYSSDPNCIKHDLDVELGEWDSHGSSVAGAAAAKIGGGDTVGIAPEAEILVYKTDFLLYSIANAIYDAVKEDVDVINLSLGAYATSFVDGFGEQVNGNYSTSYLLQDSINEAYENGVIVVAASGNEATDEKSYPANNEHVISAGALKEGSGTELAAYTNFCSSSNQDSVDILAPGTVYAPTLDNNNLKTRNSSYTKINGTSFASPIVAGAACLWKSIHPDGTPDQFEHDLKTSAYDIGEYINKNVNSRSWSSSGGTFKSYIESGRLDIEALLNARDAYVKCDSISASETKSVIEVGETTPLKIDFTPSNCTNKDIVAIPRDETIVSIDDETLMITGLKEGTTIIDIAQDDNCDTSIEITVEGGEVVPTIGGTLELVYSDFTSSYSDSAKTINKSGTSISFVNVMQSSNSGPSFQIKKGTSNYIKNTTPLPGPIKSITIDVVENTSLCYVGNELDSYSSPNSFTTSQETFTYSGNNRYFKINPMSSYVKLNKITIEYGQTSPLMNLSIKDMTTSYFIGDEFSFNGVLSAHYEDGSYKVVTPTSVSIPDMSSEGEKIITLTYTENEITRTITYSIIVSTPLLTHLSIVGDYKTNFFTNDPFSFKGKVFAHYNNGKSKDVTNFVLVSGYDMSEVGNQEVTITYEENGISRSTSYTISVIDKPVLIEITIEGIEDRLIYGSEFNSSTIKVKARLSDNSILDVSDDAIIACTIDTSILGKQSISASYTKDGITKSTSKDVFITNEGYVVPPKTSNITLVKNNSDLVLGARYVIATNVKGNTAGKISSEIMSSVKSTFSGDKETITNLNEETTILTLGGIEGAYTLTNSSGQLLGAKGLKSIVWNSGTTTWDITISGNNATIQSTTSSNGRFLYNVSSPRFTTYTSATNENMLLPQLYRINEGSNEENYAKQAKAWAKLFLDTVRDDNGPCNILDRTDRVNGLKEVWPMLMNEYQYMLDQSKDALVSLDDELISDTITLYYRIISLYEGDGLTNFIVNTNGTKLIETSFTERDNHLIPTMVILSSFSLLACSLLFYIKKKKKLMK